MGAKAEITHQQRTTVCVLSFLASNLMCECVREFVVLVSMFVSVC